MSIGLVAISILMAAAVGAKIYPVVLAPLIVFTAARRFGFKHVIAPSFVFVVATYLIMLPMFSEAKSNRIAAAQTQGQTMVDAPVASNHGMTTFFKYFEMNDFLFLVVVENLKPAELFPDNEKVWFSVVPDDARQTVNKATGALMENERFPVAPSEVPFLLSRILTSIAFLVIAFWFVAQAISDPSPARFCELAFLTLAWFWLLSPTQNPWYWIWSLPLLPFARNKTWYWIAGLAMVYYLRFWLGAHFAQSTVWGTAYHGTGFLISL